MFWADLNRFGREGRPCLFVISYDKSEGAVFPLENLPPSIDYAFNAPASNHTIVLKPKPLPFESYRKKFDALQQQIDAGNTYLANLTQPTPLANDESLETLYRGANAPFKLLWRERFACFSPEPFVTIEGDTIRTFPMKGTTEGDPQRLIDSAKELGEHTMVVDLLRNDLAQVAKNVRVEKWRYLQKAGTLWQTSSQIAGDLPSGWQNALGDLLQTLLPAGSVSGAPKKKTVEILDAIEGYDRGFFTGVFGVFDGQNLQSAVMIRFIEQSTNGLVFKSGGGITYESDAQSEYNELIAKVRLP